MILPEYPQDWPEPWLHAYQERVSIMADSRVPDAERKAEADIRKQAEGVGQASIFADMTPLRKLTRDKGAA